MTQVNFRIEEDVKNNAEKALKDMVLTMSTAITMFIKAAVREQGIPFALSINDYNKETKKVIEDANNGIGLSKAYSSVDDMMNDILKDD